MGFFFHVVLINAQLQAVAKMEMEFDAALSLQEGGKKRSKFSFAVAVGVIEDGNGGTSISSFFGGFVERNRKIGIKRRTENVRRQLLTIPFRF